MNNMPLLYYAIVPVAGLHLTCDFSVYSAALFGCEPDYQPTRYGVHEKFREPYQILSSFVLSTYSSLINSTSDMNSDKKSLDLTELLPSAKTLKDYTCLAFEIELDSDKYTYEQSEEINSLLMEKLLFQGEQIMDILRLYLYEPGKEESIGSVGDLGNGVYSIWLGNALDDTPLKFIARKLSRFQMIQPSIDVEFNKLQEIYNDETYRELQSVACRSQIHDPILLQIFKGLNGLRISRDLIHWEARFRHLAATAESLAKSSNKQRLAGDDLRKRITELAKNHLTNKKEFWGTEIKPLVDDLWSKMRNPVTHNVNIAESLGRDVYTDMKLMEKLVVAMIHGLLWQWILEDFRD